MPTPEQQSRLLEPGTLVTLYELDLSAKPSAYTGLAGPILYFHEGVNPARADVNYRGHIYTAMPIRAEGFEWTTSGTLPRPKMSVSNIGGVVSALLREYDDFVGATIVQRRTYSNFLDGAVNHGPPYQEFTPQIFVVDRKVSETNSICSFDMATGMDAEGVLLPRRQILATACSWIYRGAECTYAGPPVSDRLGHKFGPIINGTLADRPSQFGDGVTNWNSPQLASNTAIFTPDDVGKVIAGNSGSGANPPGIPYPPGVVTIQAVLNPTTIIMSHIPYYGHPEGHVWFKIHDRSGGRQQLFSDGVTNWNSQNLTSATANFTSADVGMIITGETDGSANPPGIPYPNCTIISRQSASVITMSANVYYGHPEGSVAFNIVARARSILTVPSMTFDSSFIGVIVHSANLLAGTKIVAVNSAHVVELDKKAISNGATTVLFGNISGPNGTGIAAWNKNTVYSKYDATYVPVTQPGGGVIRVYAVSSRDGNVGHIIYDEFWWMLDVCLKKQSDCELRFGLGAVLPYGGFPGASKLQ